MPRLSVSIVVPTHDRAKLLQRALRSAVPQCEPGDEVIVVDDGSTDNTEAVCTVVSARRCATCPSPTPAPARRATPACGRRPATWSPSSTPTTSGYRASSPGHRAVMEQLPDLVLLFTDFGFIAETGATQHHGMAAWQRHGVRPPGSSWATGLRPRRSPGCRRRRRPSGCGIGRLYETLIGCWCVFASTAVVRHAPALAALHFAEDVPTYEDVEGFARLAAQGPAAYMDCETAYQGDHAGSRLTDADVATQAGTALKIIGRVWGADPKRVPQLHRPTYEAIMDAHRARLFKSLLGAGRRLEARRELARFFHPPGSYLALTLVLAQP